MSAAVLPDLVIIGAPKSGTTALYQFLTDHPAVIGASAKETHFLSDPDSSVHRTPRKRPNFHDDTVAAYADLWPADAHVRIEATPSYMYHRTPLEVLGDPGCATQVVVVLRRPARRVLSSYLFLRERTAVVKGVDSFAEHVARARAGAYTGEWATQANLCIEHSRYERWLTDWSAALGDRLTIVIAEELTSSPRPVLRDLAKRLAVDPSFYDTYSFQRVNESTSVRFGSLQRAIHRVNFGRSHHPSESFLYRTVRSAYRRLNFSSQRADGTLGDADRSALAQLDSEFGATLAWVESTLGRQVGSWRSAING